MIVQANFEQRKAIEALRLDNTFFREFYPAHFYIVLNIRGCNWFTILTEDRLKDLSVTNRPYFYPKQMFNIVDDSIPQDWNLVFFKEWDKSYSVQEFNIVTYVDVERVQAQYKKKMTLFPSRFPRNIFVWYCDDEPETNKMRAPYLEELEQYLAMIRQQQNEMNQK